MLTRQTFPVFCKVHVGSTCGLGYYINILHHGIWYKESTFCAEVSDTYIGQPGAGLGYCLYTVIFVLDCEGCECLLVVTKSGCDNVRSGQGLLSILYGFHYTYGQMRNM